MDLLESENFLNAVRSAKELSMSTEEAENAIRSLCQTETIIRPTIITEEDK
ncbi:hypothetical protein QU593_10155 [Rossellomorea marisflavi]|uniref:hypothetical protein n=1 Tax=Rossellomorea marisflavi TaxID=189381 RepID=UPI0025B09CE8|nr:hypothetical protein [Rossellomorea marisflavi]WJV20767.1 hypothetical protein QU593_10155 [Rossellomorea marisflavi]